ncbi:hypothetical protein JCM6882_003123 [Rhodosporidiobolus microsporus]
MAAPTKGKARDNGTAAAFDSASDLERAPLLPPTTSDSATPSPSPSPAAAARKTRLRHGRGPIVPDSDDDDDAAGGGVNGDARVGGGAGLRPNNISEDDAESGLRYVVVTRPADASNRWTCASVACLVLGLVFCIVLVLLAAVHLWVGHLLSEQARHGTPEEMAQRGVLWEGPSAVRVQALEGGGDGKDGGGGLVVEVEGMAGVDVRKALEWENKDEDGKGWMRRWEGRVARWGVRKAKTIAVEVGEVALYNAAASPSSSSSFDDTDTHEDPLIVVPSLSTLHLPLSYPSRADPLPTLSPFTLRIPVSFPSPSDLARFGEEAWRTKSWSVRAEVRAVAVQVGTRETKGVAGWVLRRMGKVKVRGLTRLQNGEVPDLPLPSDPTQSLQNLTYSVYTSPPPPSSHPNVSSVIAFAASGLLQNPLLSLVEQGRIPPVAWGVPFRVPIEVSLELPPATEAAKGKEGKGHDEEPQPADVLLARVSTNPFSFPLGAKSANLSLSGHAVPAGNLTPSTGPSPPSSLSSSGALGTRPDQQPPLSRALSRFVARFLSGRTNTVSIRYSSHPEPPLPGDPSADAPYPPPFVADLLQQRVMKVQVPGTNETPDFFKNLRMEDMKIKLGGGEGGDDADLLASGRVVGEVVLPDVAKALEEGIDAKEIWPDVIIYDGELPTAGVSSAYGGMKVRLEPQDEADGRWAPVAASGGQLAFSPSFADEDDDEGGNPDEDDAPSYPPSPLPPNAFARMRPSSSMPATTTHIPANSTHPARTLVSALFVDAPLYLLPGRGDVLRRFVGKVVFGGKARASMGGRTSVRVGVEGFGEVSLQEIPIEAAFNVGRGGVENPP